MGARIHVIWQTVTQDERKTEREEHGKLAMAWGPTPYKCIPHPHAKPYLKRKKEMAWSLGDLKQERENIQLPRLSRQIQTSTCVLFHANRP